MSLFFFCIIGIIILYTLFYTKDFFSPARFFILLYALLLGVYFLQLSKLQTPWCFTTHLLLWGSMLTFIGGTQICVLLFQIKNPLFTFSFGNIKASLQEDARNLNWNHFSLVTNTCIVIFILSYAVAFILTKEIPAFSRYPDVARLNFLSASLPTNIGLFMGPMAMMLLFEVILFRPGQLKEKTMMFVLMGILVLLYGSIVTRTDMFRVMFFAVLLYHYGKKNLSLKHLSILAVTGVILFMIMFFIRTSTETFETFSTFLKMRLPPKLFWASNIYAYVVNNFWNFDFAVQKYVEGNSSYPFGYGFYLLRSFFFLTQTEGFFIGTYGMESIMNPMITRIESLNTIVYVWHLYKDFGPIGVFGLSFLFGALLSIFYHNTISKPSLVRIGIWSIFIGMIFLSFLNATWEFWFIYLNIFIILLAHRKIQLS